MIEILTPAFTAGQAAQKRSSFEVSCVKPFTAGQAAQKDKALVRGKRDVSTVIDILKQIAQRFMPPAVAGDEQRFTVAVQRRG